MTYRVKITLNGTTWEWAVESYSFVAAITAVLKQDRRIPPTSGGFDLDNILVFAIHANASDYAPPLRNREVRRIHTLTTERHGSQGRSTNR